MRYCGNDGQFITIVQHNIEVALLWKYQASAKAHCIYFNVLTGAY
jgi:hypothetical protein